METIKECKSFYNGGPKQFKLSITEEHIPISQSSANKQYINEATLSSPYLKKSQTIPVRQINRQYHPADDKEIRIFDARKYFDEGYEQFRNHTIKLSPTNLTEHLAEFPSYSPVSHSVYSHSARNYRPRSIPSTPVASSEASWNSQTGLLYNFPGRIHLSHGYMNPIIDEKRKISPRWFFGRICPCRDEFPKRRLPARNITNTTTPGTRQMSPEKGLFEANQSPVRISLTAGRTIIDKAGFSFPIMPPLSTSKTAMISGIHKRIAEERPRNQKAAPPRSEHEITDPKKTPKLIEDEASSDSSSDLFEIESFSTKKTYHAYEKSHKYINRCSLDEAANFQNSMRLSVITSTMNNSQNSLEDPPTPTEGYEPSEASIDWSVTTAEGFDKASVATCEDPMMITTVEVDHHGGRSRVNGLSGLGFGRDSLGGPSLVEFWPVFDKTLPVPLRFGNWASNKSPRAARPTIAL